MLEAINKLGAGIYNGFVNSKPMKKLVDGKVTRKTVDDVTAALTIGSIVLKDGIGCVMYVEQSKHNKKIPEERRNFVWKLDAVNGGLMIAFQLLFFLGVRKFNTKLLEKVIPSLKNKNISSFVEQARVDQAAAGKAVETKAELTSKFADFKYGMTSVFRSVTELVASTILAKRVVVPFIATYLTDKLENNHQKKLDAKSGQLSMTGTTEEPQKEETGANLDVTSSAETTNLLDLYQMKNK